MSSAWSGKSLESFWQGGGEILAFAAQRVVDAQFVGVKHEASGFDRVPPGISIESVADDRAAQGFLHVNADLVGATGMQMAFNVCPGGIRGGIEDAIVGDGVFAGGRIRVGHALTVNRMPGDVRPYRSGCFRGLADNDTMVNFTRIAGGKLIDERAVREVGFRGDQATAGLFIEAMNDAGTLDVDAAVESGQLTVTMVKEGVDQRAA